MRGESEGREGGAIGKGVGVQCCKRVREGDILEIIAI